jgi:hypothetical protein
MGGDFLGRAELHEITVLHDADAVAQTYGLIEVVGNEDDGLSEQLLKPQEFVLHLVTDERVERRKGLIEKPDVGRDHERAGDADALLLATRELAREIGFTVFEADKPDHFPGARFAFLAGRTAHFKGKRHIGEHVAMRQQAEVLEHHPHLVTAKLDERLLADLQKILVIEDDLSGGRIIEAGEAADESGLAGTGKTHDDQDLALLNVEGNVPDRSDISFRREGIGARLALVARQEGSRIRPEDFPQVPAQDLCLAHIPAAKPLQEL